MKKVLVTVSIAMLTLVTAVTAAPPPELHCPSGWLSKDESGADDNDLVLPAGSVICVKAGTDNTGIITADGETSLVNLLKAAGIVGGDGEGRNVSYWVTYDGSGGDEGGGETPSPTPDPSVPAPLPDTAMDRP